MDANENAATLLAELVRFARCNLRGIYLRQSAEDVASEAYSVLLAGLRSGSPQARRELREGRVGQLGRRAVWNAVKSESRGSRRWQTAEGLDERADLKSLLTVQKATRSRRCLPRKQRRPKAAILIATLAKKA